MREIKFRGRVKNTIKPQWVYGIVIPPQYSSWEDWTLFDGERRWIVDSETVGQYTGLEELTKMAENARDITTNFDRITESPEKLAEFLAHDRMECHTAVCSSISCTGCTKEGVLKWLNEESIE